MKVIYITSKNKEDGLAIAELAKWPWTHIEFIETADSAQSAIKFQQKNISVKRLLLVTTSTSIL